MNCTLCHDKGEIFYVNEDDFDFEYCQCEAGFEKWEQHELFLLDSINDNWYAGELFTTPEARQKGNEMSATALAIAEASKQAIHDEDVLDMARDLIDARNIADDDQMIKILWHYSAHLAAVTANLVTCALLTNQKQ